MYNASQVKVWTLGVPSLLHETWTTVVCPQLTPGTHTRTIDPLYRIYARTQTSKHTLGHIPG